MLSSGSYKLNGKHLYIPCAGYKILLNNLVKLNYFTLMYINTRVGQKTKIISDKNIHISLPTTL